MCVLAFEFASSQKCLVKAGKTAGLKLKIAGYLACRDKDVIDVALVVGALHAAAIAKVMNRDIGAKGHKGHIDDSCRKRVVGDVLAKVVQTRIDGLHDPIDGPGAVGNDDDAAARLGQTTAAKRIQKICLVGVAGIRGKNFCLDEIVQVVDTIIAGHRRIPFSLEATFGLLLALHYGLADAVFWDNRSAESCAANRQAEPCSGAIRRHERGARFIGIRIPGGRLLRHCTAQEIGKGDISRQSANVARAEHELGDHLGRAIYIARR